jgi:Zn-dependent M28 family amino/carboxypeptidase
LVKFTGASLVIGILFFLCLGLFTFQPSCTYYPPSSKHVSVERLRQHVAVLSEEFVPRSYEQVGNLDKCADYIALHLQQAGGEVAFQNYEVNGRAYKNVMATFGPKSPSRIVIGAHYDAYRDTPGADDNASGVAGLIELAYLLGRTALVQEVTLVAFTLEEPPYFRTEEMGSAHYAADLREHEVDVEAMICLEMIGYFSDEKDSQEFPAILLKLIYPNRGNYITVVGSVGDRKLTRKVKGIMKGATDLPVYSMTAPQFFPGVDFSDHLNFWNQGYSAVMVTDTAFYRNQGYHGEQDTVHYLDFKRMAKVVLGVYEAVIELSLEDER